MGLDHNKKTSGVLKAARREQRLIISGGVSEEMHSYLSGDR
jgi:hypothetical protein